jgi:hypothetical protein
MKISELRPGDKVLLYWPNNEQIPSSIEVVADVFEDYLYLCGIIDRFNLKDGKLENSNIFIIPISNQEWEKITDDKWEQNARQANRDFNLRVISESLRHLSDPQLHSIMRMIRAK